MWKPSSTEQEFLVLLAVPGTALLAGIVADIPWLPLPALLVYFAWHGVQLWRLERWLAHPKRYSLPVAVGIWADIGAQLEDLRERGRSRKKRLRNILGGFQESTGALPDATVVLDESWRVEWCNPIARDLIGVSRQRGREETIFDAVTDPVFVSYLREGDFARPLQMPSPTGNDVTLEVRIVPYGKGKHLIQARDITRLNQLETVRRDFVANVSHELRTPLTVIHGYLETLLEADDDDELEQWKPIVAQMHSQSTRLQGIVADLLTLSRLETRDRTANAATVDVAAMVQRIAEDAGPLAGNAGQTIGVECEAGVNLFANPGELESAFTNLLVNAIRYTPSGGHIRLHWRLEGAEPCFSVIDNGVGIDPRHIPRLTERFYRVDVGRSRDRGGTGLGLAIVKHILVRHGARLDIRSEPGSGSTFTCVFPARLARYGRVDAAQD